jgi:hypothetical protein
MKCGAKKRSGIHNNNWRQDRDQLVIEQKFSRKTRTILNNCLFKLKIKKTDTTHKILGYSSNDLYKYITNHANWDRVKDIQYNIDHIFPIKAFIDYQIFDIKLINCLDNLRPIAATENLKKNDRYCKKEFEKWLISKQIRVGKE